MKVYEKEIREYIGAFLLTVVIMQIKELTNLTDTQVKDILLLMGELTTNVVVTTDLLLQSIATTNSHFFAILEDGHIMGCATLCVFDSPTGRKASVEDVVVSSTSRGKGLGKLIMRKRSF